MRTLSPLPAAVLWDMDGTLIDTESYWMQAETDLVTSFGGTWTYDDCMLLVGSGLPNAAAVLQSRGVDMELDAIVSWLTDRVQLKINEHGLPWRPGARELLTAFAEAGVPMALVTMSIERMARQVADLIGAGTFDVIVAGDMVAQSKPHPEAYLLAASLLDVDPARCVAIEDSPTGLGAAIAAGTIAIHVPHEVDLPEADTHTRWPTLAERTLADFSALCSIRFDLLDEAAPATLDFEHTNSRATADNHEDATA
ncbi:HAD family hydrolase [Leifsonia sp. YAF41]|uniref:HAD family hydrolase n=1 Tax=Leifsonia sp. YAF41 TaxID=3233086 RepID=UPI003F981A58